MPLTRDKPIVFVSERAQEGVGDLYVMAADGSGVERLTEGGNFFVPAWAPDADGIAFRQVTALTSGIGVLSRRDPTPLLLVDGEDPQFRFRAVVWSPDGERLAYASNTDAGQLVLWTMSRNGSQRERLLPEVDTVQNSVDWLHTGEQRVAYVTGQTLAATDLWVAGTPNDPEPKNLTHGRVFAPVEPRWSPDGTKIAFGGYARLPDGSIEGLGNHDDPATAAPDEELYVVDVETEELTRITDNDSEDATPCWSPDGTALLVESDRDGDMDLWLLPLDPALEARNLTDDADLPREDGMPDWYGGGG